MNKNFKVVQIHGITGVLLVGILMAGLFCGFVLFPIWVLMQGWNAIVTDIFNGPEINYIQAVLLWGFLALSLYMTLRNSISIKIQKDDALKDLDIKSIIEEAKAKSEAQEAAQGVAQEEQALDIQEEIKEEVKK